MPGVGSYNDTVELSKFGKYQNSKYRGGTQAKFGRTSRASFVDDTVRAVQ